MTFGAFMNKQILAFGLIGCIFLMSGMSPPLKRNKVDTKAVNELIKAVFSGNRTLILNADPSIINQQSSGGSTVLCAVALYGRSDIVKAVLDKGADVNKACKEGFTPVHYAAWKCHFGILVELLKYKPDLDVFDKRGWAPLHYAVIAGHYQSVRLLLEAGASVGILTSKGNTPLHYAVWADRGDIVELLLAYKADRDKENDAGASPIG